MTGYVNENCLCFQGGFPGEGLNNLFGVISEEIDTLYPSDRNGVLIAGDGIEKNTWEVRDYAEILRVKDATVLGTYTDDFYKDTPALTYKDYGHGRAYYQAARCDLEGMDDFFARLLNESGVKNKRLPSGVEYHRRYGNDKVYEFYLNVSEKEVELQGLRGMNLQTGQEIQDRIILSPRRSLAIEI